MKKAVLWFKNDLRLHDNETLIRAMEYADELIPVYCLDEDMFKPTSFGFTKTGYFRTLFLLESLNDLDTSLRERGSGLLLIKGKPEKILPELIKKHTIQKVFAKKEVAYEELQMQDRVEQELWKNNCSLETYSTSTLYHSQDLPFSVKDIPDTFTSFRKAIEKESCIRTPFFSPSSISSPGIPALTLPDINELGFEKRTPDHRTAFPFKGGETEGLKRMQYYLFDTHSIASYKETRNGLTGAEYSSKFSAWLSLGCLSARTVYHAIKTYETENTANDSTYWLGFELLWRDYFRFMMKKHKHRMFLKNGIKPYSTPSQKHDPERLYIWVNGQTGNDFIDANMLELKHTGFMSNRGRQNVASYLCNELQVDWRYGAAYFEQQLIDYDVSSNWGNWAYLAGAGNDPRGKRIFNTDKQANDYDKDKKYRQLWLGQNNRVV